MIFIRLYEDLLIRTAAGHVEASSLTTSKCCKSKILESVYIQNSELARLRHINNSA
jgi:hypothetical protein